MAVHFLFIYTLFVVGVNGDMESGGNLSEVAQLFFHLWPALAALFASHAYSFFKNFIGRQEYRGRNLSKQMSEPYSRIVFMHMVLIFGGGLTLFLGQPAPVLIIVIGLKIYFDIKAHLKQRSQSNP
jgi:chromate transport protein ChrA